MRVRAFLLTATMLHGATTALAQTAPPPLLAATALPGAADVVHGAVTFDRSNPASLRIVQSSDRAIVNWQSFDIGAGNAVVVAQPGSDAAALFRVTGTTSSQIAGDLTANGKLFLINPNGIAIANGARVDAGSFVASTLDIADADFLSGNFQFRRSGQARGVANAGTITAGAAVALLGSSVVNDGVVAARLGRVGYAAGDAVTINFGGDNFLSVALPVSDAEGITDAFGRPLSALVQAGGTTSAEGGRIFLAAATARQLMLGAVRVDGDLVATTVSTGPGGTVSLGNVTINGGDGLVQLAGGINASGANAGGGTVSISGGAVALGGAINASGDQGGTVAVQAERALLAAGVVDARGVRGSGGSVSYVSGGSFEENTAGLTDVSGGSNGGSISVRAADDLLSSGTYLANGVLGLGGRIDLTGASVQLLSTQIAARGWQQGGLVRIGGGFMGGAIDRGSHADHELFEGRFGALPAIANAGSTFLNDGVVIDAASARGTGGSVIIWSDRQTTMLGSVRATGLLGGGAAEISGKEELRYLDLANINTGMGGRVLLDPSFITIGDAVSVSSWQYALLLNRGVNANITTLDLTNIQPAGGAFGKGVALNAAGTRLAVSAQSDSGFGGIATNIGAVRLFTFTNSSFGGGALAGVIGRGYTGTGNLDLGSALEGSDTFGNSLALNAAGDRLVVGANGDDGLNNGFSNSGSVRLFTFANTSFGGPALAGIIGRGYTGTGNVDLGSGLDNDDAFGVSVALNAAGDRLAAGAFGDDGAGNLFNNAGAVRLFTFGPSFASGTLVGTIGRGYTGGNNIDLGAALEANDFMGSGLAINGNGDRLAVGAFFDDGFGNVAAESGSVRLFTFTNTSFAGGTLAGTIGRGYTGAGDINLGTGLAAGEAHGYGIALNAAGDQLAIGAYGNTGTTASATAYGAIRFFSFGNTSFGSGTLIGTMGRGYTGAGNFDTTALGTSVLLGYSLSYTADASALVIGSPSTNNALIVRQPATGAAPGNLTFATNASGTSNISVTGLAAALSTGQSISLEASNDITLQKALNVNNASGAGGALSLRAGRSILLNAGITTDDGNLTLIANSGGNDLATVNANRQAGAASITMASGATINAGTGAVTINLASGDGLTLKTSGNIALNSITAGSIAISNAGPSSGSNIVLNSGTVLTASGSGRAIDIQAITGNFTNNAGSGALVLTGGGTYGVLSETPDGTLEGVTGYIKRYGVPNAAAFNALSPGGSFFAYRVQPSLSVFINNASRAYGDSNPAFTFSLAGFIDGDTAASAVTGAPILSSAANSSSGIGSYAITGTQGSLASALGYNFTIWGANLTVFARPITVTANAISRIYGNTNPALTYTVGGSGLVNGDTLSGVLATTATTTSNVGSYAITQGTLAAGSNYNLTSFTNGSLAVTARPLTVTANALSRVYGDANPTLTYSVGGQGLVNGDALSGALATTAGAITSVGSVAITQGTLAASSNYSLGFIGANLSITARPLTITANAQSRVYGNANPALTYTLGGQGLVNGDVLSGGLATTAGVASGVGDYAITQGTLAASSNYAVSYTGANLSVTARPLTITASNLSRVYGNANPALTFTVGGQGLVNGDTLSGALATTATTSSNVGAYAITQGTLAASSNYAVQLFNAGVLNVTARPLTITANALSSIYGEAIPALTYTLGGQGLVNGDTLSGALATTAGATSIVGSYAITQGTLAASSNYAVTYNAASLTVTARPLTLTADAQTRIYGEANPALTYTLGGMGLVNGDVLNPFLGTAGPLANVGSFPIVLGNVGNKNYAVTYVGANLTVTPRPITIAATAQSRVYGNANPSLTYTVGGMGLANGDSLSGSLATSAGLTSNVGSYAITQGTLAASGNYLLQGFTAADLVVTPRPITVAANPLSRFYGNANPVLTFTVGGQGLVNGDSLSGALATTATTTSNVGAYAITQGTLAASGNYALQGFTGANLTVAARPLTITADAKTKVYGNANPALTYTIGGLGLVNGDTVSGSLSVPAGTFTDVGSYAIQQGTLAASNNYAVNFVSANLTITPRPLTVTTPKLSSIYGQGATGPLAYTLTSGSLVGGDSFSGALATPVTTTSNVGTYNITLGSLKAGLTGLNYAISLLTPDLTAATHTVTPRPITVTARSDTYIYGVGNPLGYAVSGMGLVNGDKLTGALATSQGRPVQLTDVGSWRITQGSLTAGANYAITYVDASLTINRRPLTITAQAASQVYGDPTPALTYTLGGPGSLGLVNGNTLSGGLSTQASATRGVGSYPITSTLTAGNNYAITYVGANVTITPRPLTITALNADRYYGDGNPGFAYIVGGRGLVNGDALSGSLTSAATVRSNVGRYAITQGALSAGNNYNLTFNGAFLDVARRPITITPTTVERIYGDPVSDYIRINGVETRSLPFTVSGITQGFTTLPGLVNGDTLVGVLGSAATQYSGVGQYLITLGSLADNNPNYFLRLDPGYVLVRPAVVRVIPQPQQMKTYGQADPTFLYSVLTFRSNQWLAGLKNADTVANTFTGQLSRDVGDNAQSYWIRQGTLFAGANYTIQFEPDRFLINKARLTITAPTLTSIAGSALPIINLSYSGFVAPRPGLAVDTVASAFSVLPQASTTARSNAPGNYAITINPGIANNYIVSTSTGWMIVLPPPPTNSCCIPSIRYTPGIKK